MKSTLSLCPRNRTKIFSPWNNLLNWRHQLYDTRKWLASHECLACSAFLLVLLSSACITPNEASFISKFHYSLISYRLYHSLLSTRSSFIFKIIIKYHFWEVSSSCYATYQRSREWLNRIKKQSIYKQTLLLSFSVDIRDAKENMI